MVASDTTAVGRAIVPIIGVPHVGEIPGYFFDTVLNLQRPAGTGVVRVQNKPVDVARNLIVEAALQDERMTHLFFMDADMQFPAESLKRLIQQDKDVVGGTYFSRTETPIPHGYMFDHTDNADGSCPKHVQHSNGDIGSWYRPVHKEFAAFVKRHPEYDAERYSTVFPPTPDALLAVDAIATGCMLIKRAVLEAIAAAHPHDKRPWFQCHDGSGGGEDFYFCEQARLLGYQVWIDFSVQCAHEYRYVWMERRDFTRVFHIGEPDEHDFETPLLVDAGPPDRPLLESEAG